MRWRVALDRAVAPLGLTQPQYTVLATLRGRTRAGERPSQRRLAAAAGLETIYVSKLVTGLERAGLVERARDPADARAVRLSLTERGVEVVDPAIHVVRELHHELTAPLGGPDSARTRELRSALRTLLDASDEPETSPRTGDQP